MATNQVSLTAVGTSNPVPVDPRQFLNGVGILVNVPANTTVNYDVLVTGDDPTVGFSHWNVHDTLQSKTASANGNLAFPVTGLALRINSGAGPITMSVITAG